MAKIATMLKHANNAQAVLYLSWAYVSLMFPHDIQTKDLKKIANQL